MCYFFHLQMGVVSVYRVSHLRVFPGLPRPRKRFVHRREKTVCLGPGA